MRWLAIGAVLTLMGCSSAGSDAEKQYQIVSAAGDSQETCAAAERVASAYLKDQNEPKYREWKKTAEGYCAMARLHNYG